MEYSPVHFQNTKAVKRACAVTRTGQITVGSGVVTLTVGAAFFLGNIGGKDQPGNNDLFNLGEKMIVAGGVASLLGTFIAIGGKIHDRTKNKHNKLGLAFPKKNEIGIGYTF